MTANHAGQGYALPRPAVLLAVPLTSNYRTPVLMCQGCTDGEFLETGRRKICLVVATHALLFSRWLAFDLRRGLGAGDGRHGGMRMQGRLRGLSRGWERVGGR
ncbi:hypothetical protein BH24CHL4_BH24CHL4_00190 [soil metagenome]